MGVGTLRKGAAETAGVRAFLEGWSDVDQLFDGSSDKVLPVGDQVLVNLNAHDPRVDNVKVGVDGCLLPGDTNVPKLKESSCQEDRFPGAFVAGGEEDVVQKHLILDLGFSQVNDDDRKGVGTDVVVLIEERVSLCGTADGDAPVVGDNIVPLDVRDRGALVIDEHAFI